MVGYNQPITNRYHKTVNTTCVVRHLAKSSVPRIRSLDLQ